ncbi:hypothetical protein BaRGS_00027384 [Batillaria attramentaria]|uniref:Uncharacterized protein n=1 Tax=Batillaria attramentaria TaxID=370345 RepID=A0ABD0K2Z6_9CAEN
MCQKGCMRLLRVRRAARGYSDVSEGLHEATLVSEGLHGAALMCHQDRTRLHDTLVVSEGLHEAAQACQKWVQKATLMCWKGWIDGAESDGSHTLEMLEKQTFLIK